MLSTLNTDEVFLLLLLRHNFLFLFRRCCCVHLTFDRGEPEPISQVVAEKIETVCDAIRRDVNLCDTAAAACDGKTKKK